MSVLQLTISYAANSSASLENVFPYQRKKFLVKIGVWLVVILAGFYIYLVGAAVAGNANVAEARKALQKEHSLMQNAQGALAQKDALLQDFTLREGYQSARTFEVIRRSRNVAENSRPAFY